MYLIGVTFNVNQPQTNACILEYTYYKWFGTVIHSNQIPLTR